MQSCVLLSTPFLPVSPGRSDESSRLNRRSQWWLLQRATDGKGTKTNDQKRTARSADVALHCLSIQMAQQKVEAFFRVSRLSSCSQSGDKQNQVRRVPPLMNTNPRLSLEI